MTAADATLRREIYDFMSKVNYNKHPDGPGGPTAAKSSASEAQGKAAAKRTDYTVGVEGNLNKQFQAKPIINFGIDQATQHLRMRDTNRSIGPAETQNSFAFTTSKRAQYKDMVQSVNIPFSKYTAPSTPNKSPKK